MKTYFIVLLTLAFLTGCGGSDSADNGAPPAVSAGNDDTVLSGERYTFKAQQLNELDEDNALSFSWSQLSGPAVDFNNRQALNAGFTAPLVLQQHKLEFELTAQDTRGRSARDRLIITLAPFAPIDTSRVGLDFRKTNVSCVAGPAPTAQTSSEFVDAFPSLSDFDSPVSLTQVPDSNAYWIVAERRGKVYRLNNNDSVDSKRLIADLGPLLDDWHWETGIMSIVAHPRFEQNGFVYIYYFSKDDDGNRIVALERFSAEPELAAIDLTSRKRLLALDPPDDNANHAGGKLIFGKDGFLYLATGDGSGGAYPDPGDRAQNTKNIFGAMLRIDVDGGGDDLYAIPSDNPFVGNGLCSDLKETDSAEDCPEIFAWGLRSPWRWSFDRSTQDIWLGDVGNREFEEINRITRGGNYGWKIKEGVTCMVSEALCDNDALINPEYVLDREDFRSVTGGYVYRGEALSELRGRYVFADFAKGGIWTVLPSDPQSEPELLFDTGKNIASFAEDQNGELYVIAYSSGRIFRIQRNSTLNSGDEIIAPERLSQTGCFVNGEPIGTAIAYEVAAPFWSDSATKTRYFALPDNQQISVSEDGDFIFPSGSVVIKNFIIDDELVETRLLKQHSEGNWQGYSYEWDKQAGDAFLVSGRKQVDLGSQQWVFPSQGQCFECHTDAAGIVLGPEAMQLDFSYLYSSTLRMANQLETLHAIAAVDQLAQSDLVLVNPDDESVSLNDRARSYLHTNCSGCHRPEGPTNVDLDFRRATSFNEMNLCNVSVKNDDLDITGAKRMVPGDPERSVFLQRMMRRDEQSMPPLGSLIVDQDGVSIITEWVQSLSTCGDTRFIN